jgi:hypothetical protein
MKTDAPRGTSRLAGRRPAPQPDRIVGDPGATGPTVTARPDATIPRARPDLATLFAMRDLGMSGVVGGRRTESLSLDREARVSGSTAQAPAQAPGQSAGQADTQASARPRTVALSDGTRITFSSAGRLTESA